MKRLLVTERELRQEGRALSCSTSAGRYASGDKKFSSPCMSENDYRSAVSIDFRVRSQL